MAIVKPNVTLESSLAADWAEAMSVVAYGCVQATQNAVAEGAAEARSTHRYKDRTGTLTSTILGRVDAYSATGAEGTIEAGAFYASYVENGTPPHEIWPKEGEGFKGPVRKGQSRRKSDDIGTRRIALRWYVGGQPVFARMVFHKGSVPYPFMGQAYEKAERVLYRDIEVAIASAQTVLNK